MAASSLFQPPEGKPAGAGRIVFPGDAFVTQHHLFDRLRVVEHQYFGYINGDPDDPGTFEQQAEVPLLLCTEGSIQIDLAGQRFPISQCLGQQGRGFVQGLVDKNGVVNGVGDVAEAGHRVVQRQHQNLVGVPDLTLVADGVLGRTPGGNEPHLLTGDFHVAVTGHARTPCR